MEKDKNWLSYFNEQVNYREQYYRNNPLERDNFERKAYLEGFAEIKIYHYHTNHLGTPQELTTQDGDVIWLSYDRAWGGQFNCFYKNQEVGNVPVPEAELQPTKFQGQFFDKETNLHYNRFRYYDSDVGMFISRDPIGLLGGSNVFAYAPNPVGWIDPWGLQKSNTDFSALDSHLGANKDSVGIYRFIDSSDKIYVGSTVDQTFGERMRQHISSGKLRMEDIVGIDTLNMNGSTKSDILHTEASEIQRNGGRSVDGGSLSNERAPRTTGYLFKDKNWIEAESKMPSRFDKKCL